MTYVMTCIRSKSIVFHPSCGVKCRAAMAVSSLWVSLMASEPMSDGCRCPAMHPCRHSWQARARCWRAREWSWRRRRPTSAARALSWRRARRRSRRAPPRRPRCACGWPTRRRPPRGRGLWPTGAHLPVRHIDHMIQRVGYTVMLAVVRARGALWCAAQGQAVVYGGFVQAVWAAHSAP